MNIFKVFWDRYHLGAAVKEAMDSLPSAVCYFTPSGAVKLCNTAMYGLYRTLAGRDLQRYNELTGALEACNGTTGVIRDGNVFLFPDGHAWQYSAREIRTGNGRTYTEAVMSDVTALYEKHRELQQQSAEMKKMYSELTVLSGQLLEVTREQEILNMKALLHDQMNLGITAIRQILRQNNNSEENAAAIERFRRAIQVLETESTSPQDDLSEFLRDAQVSGIDVSIHGALPENPETLHLCIAVMREACINAARHADATALQIVSELTAASVTLEITNDGEVPRETVIPRGGLRNLKQQLEKAGGSMELCSLPVFSLLVRLPLGSENQRQEGRR